MAFRDLGKALARTDEIEITVTGRPSGRTITHPVWFAQDGKALYLLPVKGSRTEWYKNLRKNRRIVLAARWAKWTPKNVRLIRDRARVRRIADMFRVKYGAGEVKKY